MQRAAGESFGGERREDFRAVCAGGVERDAIAGRTVLRKRGSYLGERVVGDRNQQGPVAAAWGAAVDLYDAPSSG